MVTAAVKFDQGATHGVPGQALFGTTGTSVVITNGNNAGPVTRWTFTILDVPPDSAVPVGVLSDGPINSASFTPDVPDGYLIQIDVYDGSGNHAQDIRCFGVKLASGRFVPPFKAIDTHLNFSGQTRGWATYMEAWLEFLDTLGTDFTPSGTGFAHVTGGVFDPAARAVNLGTADVTGLLPLAAITPGADNTFLKSLLGLAQWSLIGTASLSPGAANTVLTTNAGATATQWSLIVDANVQNLAAINGTKINPNFGSQNVSTTGSGSFNSLSIGVLSGVLHATAGAVTTSQVVLTSEVTGRLPLINLNLGNANSVLASDGVTNFWSNYPTVNGIVLATSPALQLGGSLLNTLSFSGTALTIGDAAWTQIKETVSATGTFTLSHATALTWSLTRSGGNAVTNTYDAAATSVSWNQNSTTGATAATWTLTSQTSTNVAGTGGDFILATGTGTSANGNLRFSPGNVDSGRVNGAGNWLMGQSFTSPPSVFGTTPTLSVQDNSTSASAAAIALLANPGGTNVSLSFHDNTATIQAFLGYYSSVFLLEAETNKIVLECASSFPAFSLLCEKPSISRRSVQLFGSNFATTTFAGTYGSGESVLAFAQALTDPTTTATGLALIWNNSGAPFTTGYLGMMGDQGVRLYSGAPTNTNWKISVESGGVSFFGAPTTFGSGSQILGIGQATTDPTTTAAGQTLIWSNQTNAGFLSFQGNAGVRSWVGAPTSTNWKWSVETNGNALFGATNFGTGVGVMTFGAATTDPTTSAAGQALIWNNLGATGFLSLQGNSGLRMWVGAPTSTNWSVDVEANGVALFGNVTSQFNGGTKVFAINPTSVNPTGTPAANTTNLWNSAGSLNLSANGSVNVYPGISVTGTAALSMASTGSTWTTPFVETVGQTSSVYVTLAFAANTNIDWSQGNNEQITLTGNITFTQSNMRSGADYTLRIVQDGTGGRTITWPGTMKFPTVADKTPSPGANDVTIYRGKYNGTNVEWLMVAVLIGGGV